MKLEQLTRDAAVFIFDEIKDYSTNVFVLAKKSHIFVIDTFCGEESMTAVKKYIEAQNKEKNRPIVIINTHFHWDHIWGNCAFKNSDIIGHEKCRVLIEDKWEMQYKKNRGYISGRVEKVIPNITISDRLIYNEDNIEIFYTPGHTADSISVYDNEEKVLYTGDNLEKPIIYVEDTNIDRYIETLKNYIKYDAEKIMAGHTLFITKKEIEEMIDYLIKLKNGEKINFSDEYMNKINNENFNLIWGKETKK